MLLTRASDPPFVDHSTIPRVDITEMNTRARFSKSICTKHSPQQHFPIGYLRCYNFFVVTKLSPSSFKVTLFDFCFFNLHNCIYTIVIYTIVVYLIVIYTCVIVVYTIDVDFDVRWLWIFDIGIGSLMSYVNARSGSAHFRSSNVDFDVHWLWIYDIGIVNLGDSCLS